MPWTHVAGSTPPGIEAPPMATPLRRPRGGGRHRPAAEPRTTCGAWASQDHPCGNTVRAAGQGSVHLFLPSAPASLPPGKSAQEDKRRDSEHRLRTGRKIKPKGRRSQAPLSFLAVHVTQGPGGHVTARAPSRAGGQRASAVRAPSRCLRLLLGRVRSRGGIGGRSRVRVRSEQLSPSAEQVSRIS